ncbi:MAG TPA: hypothetical protein VI488_15460 [Candidatus Angelobacter sp.]
MKRIASALLATVSGLLGLLLIPTVLYNVAGLLEIQDGADGPKWMNALVLVACIALVSGAFFLSFRLFRSLAAPRADSK